MAKKKTETLWLSRDEHDAYELWTKRPYWNQTTGEWERNVHPIVCHTALMWEAFCPSLKLYPIVCIKLIKTITPKGIKLERA